MADNANDDDEVGESVNIVLGHSVRAAVAEMQSNPNAATVCIISPSPRADRRMSDDAFLEIFQTMGRIMGNLSRLEIHFYASDQVWMPAVAMAAFLRNSPRLTYLLMNGMRVKGGIQEMIDLGHAFRLHPTLARMCCFNIQSLAPDHTPLNPMLELIVKNPGIEDLALRYTNWSSESLGVICDSESQIKTIRLTGKDTLGKDTDKLPLLLESLKTNTMLTELRINQCPAPPGTGRLLGDMLRVNVSLRSVLVEFQSYLDAVPVAQAIESDNQTLTTLDMYTASEAVRRVQEERRQRAMQEMRTNGNNWRELRESGGLRGIVMTAAEKEKEAQDIRHMRIACIKALMKNTTLTTLVLNTSSISLVTPQMELFLRMNREGLRRDLLQNDDLTREEVLDFMARHNDDTTLVWFLLRMKPDLISLAISRVPVLAKKARKSGDSEPPLIPSGSSSRAARAANRKRRATKAAADGHIRATKRTSKRTTGRS